MSDSEPFRDPPDEEPKVLLSADQIKQLIENHEEEWKEVASIPFWQEVAGRYIIGTAEYTSVKEILARFRIVPRFVKFEEVFQEALKEKLLSKVENLKTAIEFVNSIAVTLQKVDETSVTVHQEEQKKIDDKITNKRREVLAAEFSKVDTRVVEYLFPRCADWKIQDLFMALRTTERENWSERTYDNLLYSAIFQRYFNDDFSNLGDQKINQYLPSRVKNEIKFDLILLSDDSPFLICEYGEEDHSSNHKDLIKLLESMQRVLTKRHEQFEKYTSFIYGVLCGGSKMTLFYMEYDAVNNNFPCYFVASNKRAMSTITLQLENMGAILKMNIVIMIGGTVQTVKKPRHGKEKTQSTLTPSKIDDSRILSSHQTGKKTKAKGDKSSSNSDSKNTVARHLEFDVSVEESELVSAVAHMQIGGAQKLSKSSKSSSKKTSAKSSSKSEVCAPSTSTSEQQSDDTRCDNSSGGLSQNKQQHGNNSQPKPTQTATTTNNNNNANKSNKNNNSDTKEKRKAMLAKFTQVNAVIGTSGRYYKVTDRITDMVHFVVHKHCCYIAKLSFMDKLSKEEEILNQLSDDNFIKPYDSFKVADGLIHCLIFPYEPPFPWTTEREFRKSAYEVLCAIAELHELNIMHGDVKYSNIIRGDYKTYLIDFDLAVQDPETYTTKYHGTFGYRAPESIKNGTLSLKMDIYSYGIYLYELAHNQKMYKILGVQEDDEEDAVVAKLKEAIKRMPVELKRCAKLFDLITQCMTEDPELRPTAAELMKNPFFDMIRPKLQREKDKNIAPVSSPTKVKPMSGKNKLLSSPFRDITNTVK